MLDDVEGLSYLLNEDPYAKYERAQQQTARAQHAGQVVMFLKLSQRFSTWEDAIVAYLKRYQQHVIDMSRSHFSRNLLSTGRNRPETFCLNVLFKKHILRLSSAMGGGFIQIFVRKLYFQNYLGKMIPSLTCWCFSI